jgi:valyl-tRNA synthetase
MATSTNRPLPKTYAPADEEPRIRAAWRERGAFHPDPAAVNAGRRTPYAIVIPPPNVTAALHLGHALNNTLQDILIRHYRMRGFETIWLPGTDHAGIATQTVVEKRLLAEQGKRRTDYERDDFVGLVQEWKDEYEERISHQLEEMGCSCDWDRQRFTMDDQCARAVREAFFQLFRDGLIYRGKRLVNWDPVTETALADDEVEDHEIEGHFWYMRYPLVGEPVTIDGETVDHVTVATTRPETMLGDTAIAINPRDPRAEALRGRKVLLPIANREIPIIEDDYVVLPVRFGGPADDPKAQMATGYLKVTPAHDPNDWSIGERHDLPVINIFAPNATISREHGWPEHEWEQGAHDEVLENLLGMDRYEAREAIVDWFRTNDLLEAVKPYAHTVGHSYRSHVAIEPYLSDQWWVKVTDDRLAGAALRAVDPEQRETDADCVWKDGDPFQHMDRSGRADWEGGLTFFPDRYAKTFQTWHFNIRDWCISRQLWWGHRIPVWSATEEDASGFDPDRFDGRVACSTYDGVVFACVRDREDTEIVEQLESAGFAQDPDVLDTWFSSALWPLSTMGWPDETELLQAYNPSNVLCTAREIITLWVSRMVMFNTYFLDRLPFRHVFIHAMIQDGDGRKMSKSLGNGVDPLDIIHSHGSDAMRFTLCQMTTNTQDVRMPVELDETTGRNTSPKFDIGRNFCNKLWNASSFSLHNLASGPIDASAGELALADRWMLSRLASTIDRIDEAVASYQFNVYAQHLYDVFWRDFCDFYVEAIKPTVRENPAQRAVLRTVLDSLLRLIHPICPFITETVFERLAALEPSAVPGLVLGTGDFCANAPWPVADDGLVDPEAEREFEAMRELIAAIREARAQRLVPTKRRITLHTDRATIDRIDASGPLVPTLCMLETTTTEPASGDHAVITALGREHALSNLADVQDAAIELERLQKNLADVTSKIEGLEKRLANPGYTEKAPAHLVEQTRLQLATLVQEKQTIQTALETLA